MIIVMARVKIRPGRMQEALDLSNKHVARSRLEPGCISHGVYRDGEHDNDLVFVEERESEQALKTHFAVPASQSFVKELVGMSVGRQQFRLYSATEMPFPHLGAA